MHMHKFVVFSCQHFAYYNRIVLGGEGVRWHVLFYTLYFAQVLPYWNWAELYSEECLVENPYYKGQELLEEDCEVSTMLTLPLPQQLLQSD